MATYNVPNISGDELAGLLNSYGGSYDASPDGSGGYNVNASPLSGIGAALGGSSGMRNSNSATPSAPAADSPMMGNGNYADGSKGGSAQTDKPVNTGGSVAAFMKEYGADAAAIVVGVLIVAAAVWRIA